MAKKKKKEEKTGVQKRTKTENSFKILLKVALVRHTCIKENIIFHLYHGHWLSPFNKTSQCYMYNNI